MVLDLTDCRLDHIYGLIGLIINGLFNDITNLASLGFTLLVICMMLFSSHSLRYFLKKYQWMELPFWKLLPRVFTIFLVAAVLINCFNSVYLVYVAGIFKIDQFSFPVFLLYVFQTLIWFFLWFGIYFGVFYFRNYKSEEVEKWKLQTSLKDAELIALKAQINPHFLFNALNNIRALILEDQMKARDMVSHLSELLRYSIRFSEHEKVKVSEELEIVKKYLELESTHYEGRLQYEIKVEQEVYDFKIPPMAVQLLVENAVKHGISQEKNGGEILISIYLSENLNIEVKNTGTLAKSEQSGLGIKNITERIRILFEKEPHFVLAQKDKMVQALLKLPAQK